MKVQEAVIIRIKELCKKNDLKINGLAHHAGIPASTLKNIIKGKSKNPGITTIKKICDGLDISLHEFFNANVFHDFWGLVLMYCYLSLSYCLIHLLTPVFL